MKGSTCFDTECTPFQFHHVIGKILIITYSSFKSKIEHHLRFPLYHRWCSIMAEKKGFEPLWGFPQTVFKTASL